MVEKDWYSPGEIKFTRPTARWLIHNLNTLREGTWPPEASNYIDIAIRSKPGHKAPFITPIEYAAEITTRMQKCGIDGLMLLVFECWGESEESLSKYFGVPAWSIRKRKSKALGYVASGPARRWHNTRKRKGETYQQFRQDK